MRLKRIFKFRIRCNRNKTIGSAISVKINHNVDVLIGKLGNHIIQQNKFIVFFLNTNTFYRRKFAICRLKITYYRICRI